MARSVAAIGAAAVMPCRPGCQARFPAEIIDAMYRQRSVSFFMLLRVLDEGDVPRGALEIEPAGDGRKAWFLQPA